MGQCAFNRLGEVEQLPGKTAGDIVTGHRNKFDAAVRPRQ
jgi:hypothetical protein